MLNTIAICYQMPGYSAIEYQDLGRMPLDAALQDIAQDFEQDHIIVCVEVWTVDAAGLNHCYARNRQQAGWTCDE